MKRATLVLAAYHDVQFSLGSMRIANFLITLAVVAPLHCLIAQGEVYVSDKLPSASIELKPHSPPATSKPWQLPKPGHPLYDAKKEADIKNNKHSPWARAFERGVFKGYARVTSGPRRAPAKKWDRVHP